MSDINQLIQQELDKYPADVVELAAEALKLSQVGLSDAAIAEALENIVRHIARKKGTEN